MDDNYSLSSLNKRVKHLTSHLLLVMKFYPDKKMVIKSIQVELEDLRSVKSRLQVIKDYDTLCHRRLAEKIRLSKVRK